MAKRKLCIVYESFFSLGGIQRCSTIIANYLASAGFEVTLLCLNEKKSNINYGKYGLDRRVKVVCTPSHTVFKIIYYSWRRPLKFLNDRVNFLRHFPRILYAVYSPFQIALNRNLRKISPDITIACAMHGLLLTRHREKIPGKIIGWQHSCFERYFKTHGLAYWNQETIFTDMVKKMDAYVVLTEYDKEQLQRHFNLHSIVIDNPVSFRRMHAPNLLANKILAVGRLDYIKNFDTLIKNFLEFSKKHKDWTLQITGEGKERGKLEKLIAKLGLCDKVTLPGRTNNMAETYEQSSMYCLTSKAEGSSMAILEALESGLPVVAFNLPSIEEVVGNNGIIVPNGDNEKFVKSMDIIASDYNLRKKYSKLAMRRSKDYYTDKIGAEWIKLFNEIITED